MSIFTKFPNVRACHQIDENIDVVVGATGEFETFRDAMKYLGRYSIHPMNTVTIVPQPGTYYWDRPIPKHYNGRQIDIVPETEVRAFEKAEMEITGYEDGQRYTDSERNHAVFDEAYAVKVISDGNAFEMDGTQLGKVSDILFQEDPTRYNGWYNMTQGGTRSSMCVTARARRTGSGSSISFQRVTASRYSGGAIDNIYGGNPWAATDFITSGCLDAAFRGQYSGGEMFASGAWALSCETAAFTKIFAHHYQSNGWFAGNNKALLCLGTGGGNATSTEFLLNNVDVEVRDNCFVSLENSTPEAEMNIITSGRGAYSYDQVWDGT